MIKITITDPETCQEIDFNFKHFDCDAICLIKTCLEQHKLVDIEQSIDNLKTTIDIKD